MPGPARKTRAALLLLTLVGGCVSEADAPGTARSTEPAGPASAEVVAASASPSDALEIPSLSPLGHEAFERLLHARRFTDDAIDYAGVTPNEVIALRLLWREPQALETFEALLESATLAGQLFALCGLYYTAPTRFEEAVQAYRDRSEQLA